MMIVTRQDLINDLRRIHQTQDMLISAGNADASKALLREKLLVKNVLRQVYGMKESAKQADTNALRQ